jgi:hypothetical protein
MIKCDIFDTGCVYGSVKSYNNVEKIQMAKFYTCSMLILRGLETVTGIFTPPQMFTFFTVFSMMLYFLYQNDLKTVKLICFLYYIMYPVLIRKNVAGTWGCLLSSMFPVTFPVIILMTTRSLMLTLFTFIFHSVFYIAITHSQTIDYMVHITNDNIQISQAITAHMLHCLDCGLIVLTALITHNSTSFR